MSYDKSLREFVFKKTTTKKSNCKYMIYQTECRRALPCVRYDNEEVNVELPALKRIYCGMFAVLMCNVYVFLKIPCRPFSYLSLTD